MGELDLAWRVYTGLKAIGVEPADYPPISAWMAGRVLAGISPPPGQGPKSQQEVTNTACPCLADGAPVPKHNSVNNTQLCIPAGAQLAVGHPFVSQPFCVSVLCFSAQCSWHDAVVTASTARPRMTVMVEYRCIRSGCITYHTASCLSRPIRSSEPKAVTRHCPSQSQTLHAAHSMALPQIQVL